MIRDMARRRDIYVDEIHASPPPSVASGDTFPARRKAQEALLADLDRIEGL
jgi:hypothetical protein